MQEGRIKFSSTILIKKKETYERRENEGRSTTCGEKRVRKCWREEGSKQSKVLALKRRSLSATGSCGNCCGGRARSLDNSHSENFTPTEILYSPAKVLSFPLQLFSIPPCTYDRQSIHAKAITKEEISFFGDNATRLKRHASIYILEIYLFVPLFTLEMV